MLNLVVHDVTARLLKVKAHGNYQSKRIGIMNGNSEGVLGLHTKVGT
jgi:hypothetical protein